jgi:hypothetical protein
MQYSPRNMALYILNRRKVEKHGLLLVSDKETKLQFQCLKWALHKHAAG